MYHVPKTEQIIVCRSYMSDWQVWVYFINTYKPIIQVCCPEVHSLCLQWLQNWTRNIDTTLSISEQKTILFTAVPHLENVWGKWTQCMLSSNSFMRDMEI